MIEATRKLQIAEAVKAAEAQILDTLIALQDSYPELDIDALNLSAQQHAGYANSIRTVEIDCNLVDPG